MSIFVPAAVAFIVVTIVVVVAAPAQVIIKVDIHPYMYKLNMVSSNSYQPIDR